MKAPLGRERWMASLLPRPTLTAVVDLVRGLKHSRRGGRVAFCGTPTRCLDSALYGFDRRVRGLAGFRISIAPLATSWSLWVRFAGLFGPRLLQWWAAYSDAVSAGRR